MCFVFVLFCSTCTPIIFFKQATAYVVLISDLGSDVCSSDLVSFRDLEGLGYSEAEVKAIAANWSIETTSVDPETGEASTRKPIPAAHIPLPFAKDVAARAANNNVTPPDLSLMKKARNHGHAYKTGREASRDSVRQYG